jgi:chorismate mutase
MDGQILFNILIGVCGTAGGWVLKMIWDVISELRKDVKELNREVNQDFVRRQDFREAVGELKADMKEGFKEVKDAIALLFDRVNEKADK